MFEQSKKPGQSYELSFSSDKKKSHTHFNNV